MCSGPFPGNIWKHWKRFRKPLLPNHLPFRKWKQFGNLADQMETSDLPSDTNATNATVAMNCLTESKSVKRRSRRRPVSHGTTHRISIDTCISHSGIVDAGFDGRNTTMSRSKAFPRCMTLRLSAPMESDLETLAYDWRLSKAGAIRQILRRATAHEHDLPDQYRQVHGGEL